MDTFDLSNVAKVLRIRRQNRSYSPFHTPAHAAEFHLWTQAPVPEMRSFPVAAFAPGSGSRHPLHPATWPGFAAGLQTRIKLLTFRIARPSPDLAHGRHLSAGQTIGLVAALALQKTWIEMTAARIVQRLSAEFFKRENDCWNEAHSEE